MFRQASLATFRIFLAAIFVAMPHPTSNQGHAAKIVEAMMARVGEESIRHSDLIRYKAVVDIMYCSGLRLRPPGSMNESVRRVLNTYVDEELVFLEAKTRMPEGSGGFTEAVRKIRVEPKCANRWRSLGERYGQIFRAKTGDLMGESLLVRELEKRLLIDKFIKEKLGSDVRSWMQEARVRVPVKIFAE